jgi:uncharacterized OB-fold protein
MMGAHLLQPNVADRETAGFFEAAAEGRLVYRACNDCQHALHPPTDHCPHCGGWNTAWRAANGVGRLHSWTTVTHQVHPDFPAPYTLVVVELDDAPEVRLMGRLDGAPELEPNLPMEVWFERLGDGPVLPQWRPAKA